jgi:sugar lactone lactonase YvrE
MRQPAGPFYRQLVGRAGLLRVDVQTGAYERWVRGLGMANGVARAPDGTIYASNGMGTHVERITLDGAVQRRWERVASANGLAVDHDGRFLYAARTFVAARVSRIDLGDHANVVVHARAPRAAAASMLDGLAIDAAGRLFAAANAAGQVWRVDTDGSIRVLACGLRCPSAVVLGKGARGFSEGSVFAVTFAGDIVELPGVG